MRRNQFRPLCTECRHRFPGFGGTMEGEKIPYINHIACVTMEVMAVSQQETFDANLAIQLRAE